MSRLTGDPLYDLLILLVFVAGAIALVRSRMAAGRGARPRGWSNLRRERRAELAARRGTGAAPEETDDAEVEDSTPLVHLVRRRVLVGGAAFITALGCVIVYWVWRWTQG